MQIFILLTALLQLTSQTCKQVEVQQNFDLKMYASKKWWVQYQALTKYLPKSWNYCGFAEYEILEKKTFWNYDIQVHNVAYESNHVPHDSKEFLCAKKTDDPAKLVVAPCFLPDWRGWFSGDYWILYYNEEEGLAIVSGGQPKIEGDKGCLYDPKSSNQSGLWVLTRNQQVGTDLIQNAMVRIVGQGIDPSILNKVDQTNC